MHAWMSCLETSVSFVILVVGKYHASPSLHQVYTPEFTLHEFFGRLMYQSIFHTATISLSYIAKYILPTLYREI